MIKFLNGPAEGTVLELTRAPKLLRVVIDPRGKVDALDKLDDYPQDNETLHAYRRVGLPTRFHLRSSRRSGCGFRYAAEYEYVELQPDDATMRDAHLWWEWAFVEGQSTETITRQS